MSMLYYIVVYKTAMYYQVSKCLIIIAGILSITGIFAENQTLFISFALTTLAGGIGFLIKYVIDENKRKWKEIFSRLDGYTLQIEGVKKKPLTSN